MSRKSTQRAFRRPVLEVLEQRQLLTAAYTVNWLGTVAPTDNYSQATRINDHGQVIGASIQLDSAGLPTYEKAFSWTPGGGMAALGNLNGNASYAWGLNNTGKVVGWYHYPVTQPGTTASGGYYEYAAVWNNGAGTTIPGATGYMWSTAYGVNDNNIVVGVSDTPAGGGRSEGFTYDGTTLKFLGTLGGQWSQAFSINNNNVVAGFADTGTRTPPPGATAVSLYHACIWSPSGQITDLGTLGSDSYAYKINDLGQVVGSSITVDAAGNALAYHPFLYDGTKLIDLVGFGGNGTAWSINNLGQVVGGSAGSAFLYENGAMVDLNGLVPAGSGTLTEAMDINNLGQIVGMGLHNGQTEAFVLTPGGTIVLPPTANVGGPYSVTPGSPLTLDASKSASPDKLPLSYSWDVNGDGVYGDATGVAPTVSWTSLQALGIVPSSVYNVSVQVSDGAQTASAATTLTVAAVPIHTPPTAGITAGDAFKGVRGQNRSFILGATDPSAADQAAGFTFHVDWGDGKLEDYVGLSGLAVTHKYTGEGSYSITLTAKDQNDDASAPVTTAANIQVTEQQGPVLALGGTTGNDLITLSPGGKSGSLVTPYGTFATSQVMVYGNGGNDTLTIQGTTGSDAFSIGSTAVTVKGVAVSTTNVESVSVDALAGADTFTIAGTGLRANLKGGDGNDRFIFAAGAALAGKIDGGAGADTLDYAAYGSAVIVNLNTLTATATAGVAGLEGLVGSAQSDTLVGPSSANTWSITGNNAGKLGTLAFSAVENLQGGAQADTFKFSAGATLAGTVDGGAGLNTLDFSAYTTAVSVNLAAGAANAVSGGVRNIVNLTGGSAGDTLIGDAADNLLLGNAGDDILSGGGGNDILVGGAGNDTLTASGTGRNLLIGGAGADKLTGGSGEDILVGGTTSYDANSAALLAILAEWKRIDLTYLQRIDHLRGTTAGGLNGSYQLKSTTVKDDATADVISGGAGNDWFWANTAKITDLAAGEKVK